MDLKRALKEAQEKFPEAEIFIPVMNFSKTLLKKEQDTLFHLNKFISGLKEHIPALPAVMFSTEKEDIHWTGKAALCILEHWNEHLNGASP